jgi:dipeptidyl aminopeptidase/acylaminoacyl peptidase
MSAALVRSARVASALLALPAALSCGASVESSGSPTGVTSRATTGTLVVALRTTGSGADADGIGATVGITRSTLRDGEPVVHTALQPGTMLVRLDGIAPHCQAAADTVSATVRAGLTDTLSVALSCVGGIAYHVVTGPAEFQIRYLTPDGRTVELTSGPNPKSIESWSPDGSTIVFGRWDGDEKHLFAVRTDGTNLVQLTRGRWFNHRARWSPDGARIAFHRRPGGDVVSHSWIVVMDANGGNERELMDTLHFDFDPVWSRDGAQLYFTCDRFVTTWGLCTASATGDAARPIKLPAVDSLDVHPPCPPTQTCVYFAAGAQHWEVSPDGTALTFSTLFSPNDGPQAMWVASLDGTKGRTLTPGVPSFTASWAPDGNRLLVGTADHTTFRGYALVATDRDGSSSKQFADYPAREGGGRWSSDGVLVAFDGFRSGLQRVWIANPDGTGARQLLADKDPPTFLPVWNPSVRGNVPLRATAALVSASGTSASRSASLDANGSAAMPWRGECRMLPLATGVRADCGR